MAQLLQHGINRISISFYIAFSSMSVATMIVAAILCAASFVLIGIGLWADRVTAAINTDRILYRIVGIGVIRHYLQVCATLLLFLHHARNAVHRVVGTLWICRVCES